MDATVPQGARPEQYVEARPMKRVRHYHQLPGNVLSQNEKRRLSDIDHAYNDSDRKFTLGELKEMELPLEDILPRVTVDGFDTLKECAEVVDQLLAMQTEFDGIVREIASIRSSFTDIPDPSAEQLRRAIFIINLERNLEKFNPSTLIPRSIRRRLKATA